VRLAPYMPDARTTRPNAVMAWMYRLVPKLPKQMRPKKMIVLHHVGRRSGLARETGLQRIYHDADSGQHYVAAAYGPTSDWWLNVLAEPRVTLDVDGQTLEADGAVVPADKAIDVLESATRNDAKLRGQVFKHAGVDPDDPDGLAQVIAVNPLMVFTEI
jgi:deazaflavin-dependent oxidoreductase (nitroreductase family)